MPDTETTEYKDGWRSGMFDKCNGRPEQVFVAGNYTEEGIDFIAGYWDGYIANERMV